MTSKGNNASKEQNENYSLLLTNFKTWEKVENMYWNLINEARCLCIERYQYTIKVFTPIVITERSKLAKITW